MSYRLHTMYSRSMPASKAVLAAMLKTHTMMSTMMVEAREWWVSILYRFFSAICRAKRK